MTRVPKSCYGLTSRPGYDVNDWMAGTIRTHLIAIEGEIAHDYIQQLPEGAEIAISAGIKGPQFNVAISCTLKLNDKGRISFTDHKKEFLLSDGAVNELATKIPEDPDAVDAALLLIAGWPKLKDRLQKTESSGKASIEDRIRRMLDGFEV